MRSLIPLIVGLLLLCASVPSPSAGQSLTVSTKGQELLLSLLKESNAALGTGNLKFEVREIPLGEDLPGRSLGLFATEDIQPGDELFLIHSDSVLQSTEPALVQAVHDKLSDSPYKLELTTALLLLNEKHSMGAESKWAKYIELLPKKQELSAFPLFWRGDTVQELSGSIWTLSKISQLREALSLARTACLAGIKPDNLASLAADGFATSQRGFLTPEACEVEELRWAITVVISRFWKEITPDNFMKGLLLPGIDLLLPKIDGKTKLGSTPEGHYIVRAIKPIEKGGRLTVIQDSKPTFLTALDHAYLPPEEDWNLHIISAFQSDTPFGRLQENLLKALNCYEHFRFDLYLAMPTDQKPSANRGFWEFLACRRIESLTPDEYARIYNPNMTYDMLKQAASQPISMDNELRSVKKLRSDITEALRRYVGKIETDDALLNDPTVASDRHIAVALRKAEKYVWIAAYNALEKHWLRFLK